jgi:hypothetical protein
MSRKISTNAGKFMGVFLSDLCWTTVSTCQHVVRPKGVWNTPVVLFLRRNFCGVCVGCCQSFLRCADCRSVVDPSPARPRPLAVLHLLMENPAEYPVVSGGVSVESPLRRNRPHVCCDCLAASLTEPIVCSRVTVCARIRPTLPEDGTCERLIGQPILRTIAVVVRLRL